MDYQTFRTRADAQAAILTVRGWGWNARATQLYLPENENANKEGNAWVVEFAVGTPDPKYLRTDGYVR